ncbi:UNVERIFIED_CONTAM: hypothetical protein FKN15_050671 [Acipenser sinensis]
MGVPTGSVSRIHFLFLASLVYGLVLILPTSGFSLMNCTVHSSPNATNLKVRCFNKRFYHVPTDKPAKTRLLDIAGNLISRLRRGDFTNLTYMRELNISHNHIHHIDEGTFRDLAALKELNLAENNLSVLCGRLFEGLKNLTVLQLGGNRIQEIHQSTFQPLVNVKTLCIISRHYLESEWCSREIQVASFRLFDEHKDVLVLVFLEDIPDCQLSPYHRMRKLVKKKTYLNWPKCEEETRLFWHKLNTALETREEPNEESPILSGLETCD